jgi:hypothetical protein
MWQLSCIPLSHATTRSSGAHSALRAGGASLLQKASEDAGGAGAGESTSPCGELGPIELPRRPRRGRSNAEFRAKLGIVFEEADECVDALEYFRDARISHDQALVQEARELASIFAKSVSTTRKNAERVKRVPHS